MQNNDDETAFPVEVGQVCADNKGMSLRDWFAGMAMQGMLASEPNDIADYDAVASDAYRYANEMMEARKTLG